jgi:hypothetical protein
VKTLSAIRNLLAIVAIVGLVLGPIARPVMAMPAPMHTSIASDQAMVDGTAMAMPEDMPCCPTKAPIPDCGKDCLFMAMCATQFLANAVQEMGLVIPLGLASVFFPGNDTDVAGLSQGPASKTSQSLGSNARPRNAAPEITACASGRRCVRVA